MYSVADAYLCALFADLSSVLTPTIHTLLFLKLYGVVIITIIPTVRKMRLRGVKCAIQGHTASKEVANLKLEPRCLDLRICALKHYVFLALNLGYSPRQVHHHFKNGSDKS